MGNRGAGALPPEVSVLQQEVEAWRRTRRKGDVTPSRFWDAATPLAMQFGVCRIGRAVGLDYTCLRRQVAKAREKLLNAPVTFLEIPPASLLPAASSLAIEDGSAPRWPPSTGSVIELSTPDGAQMRICLEPGKGHETALIVAAFLRRGH